MNHQYQSPFQTRQEMQEENFELFYYSDDNLEEVRSHKHSDFYELTFFLSGEANLLIDNKRYVCHQADCVLIIPGQIHENQISRTRESYDRFVLWLSQDYVRSLIEGSDDFRILFEQAKSCASPVHHFEFSEFAELTGLLLKILEQRFKGGFGARLMMNNTLENFLILWGRGFFFSERKSEEPSLIDGVLNYIDTHLSEELSLDQLENRFFVSRFHLSRVFRKTMGVSLHQYILKKRLQAAYSALATDASLQQIAEQCGFSDYSAFFRAFKKEYGHSPARAREGIQKTLRDARQKPDPGGSVSA